LSHCDNDSEEFRSAFTAAGKYCCWVEGCDTIP
jgi:hypothetical protein